MDDQQTRDVEENEESESLLFRVCRICYGESFVRHHIFSPDRLCDKITACLPLTLSSVDHLPKKICDDCVLRIEDICRYRDRAKLVEARLLSDLLRLQNDSSHNVNLNNFDRAIKEEPPDDVHSRREDEGDPFGNTAPQKFFVSRCTQTELSNLVTTSVKDETLPSSSVFVANPPSSGDDIYSSEDDLTLNNVARIPPIKLKLKREYYDETSTKSVKKPKKKKKESKTRDKTAKKRDKKSARKYSDVDESFHPDVIIKTEHLNNDSNLSERNVSEVNTEADQWQCLICMSHLKSRGDLLQHYKDHVENPMKLCARQNIKLELNISQEVSAKSDGDESIESENKLYIPIRPKDLMGGLAYQCLKCYKYFLDEKSVQRHLVSHDDSRPFVCNLCGRAYKKAYEILLHGRAHSGIKTLFCRYELCNYSTVYRGALLSHQKRHQPDFKYTCDVCNKGFDVLTWFTEHKNIHTGDKPFSCEICKKSFVYSRYLTSHRKNVHPETNARKLVHRCNECNLDFPYRKKLQRHIAHTHSGEYGFQCLCDICGKRLSSKEHLKFHRRIHTGEKPHACRTCGKAFVKKCNLTLHERVHSGERPHVCSHCGKAFSQRSTLVIHERYHSGARPYQCEHCKKGFVAKGLLSMHQKTCNS